MNPVFSVITVHFNQLPLLKSTVENVVSQTGFGELIEYIIVDGLSMDGTIDYLHELKVEKSIKRIIERDHGIYDAMNKGIQAAKGEYVIFINAGDRLTEADTLFKISGLSDHADVIYGDTEINYPSFTRIAKSKPLDKFWQSLPFVHQSVLVKREILVSHLFDLQYKYCADYDLLSKLYVEKRVFKKMDQPIAAITAGGASDIHASAATREVYAISKKRFGLSFWQKMYFMYKMIRSKLGSFGKKNLPANVVQGITKQKYR
ncbi:MAG: glycosyltransferase [Crocinitomicaceae bacterium]|nr:glycosyltransferase [Crocinitomicaceae bacterium]